MLIMKLLQGKQRKELLYVTKDGKWVQNFLSVPYTKFTYSDFRVEVENREDKIISRLFKTNEDDSEMIELLRLTNHLDELGDYSRSSLLIVDDKDKGLVEFTKSYLFDNWIYPIYQDRFLNYKIIFNREIVSSDKKGRPLCEIISAKRRDIREKITNYFIHGFNGSYVLLTPDEKNPEEYFYIFIPTRKDSSLTKNGKVKNVKFDSKNRVTSLETTDKSNYWTPSCIGPLTGTFYFEYDEFDNIVSVRAENGSYQQNKFDNYDEVTIICDQERSGSCPYPLLDIRNVYKLFYHTPAREFNGIVFRGYGNRIEENHYYGFDFIYSLL